MPRHLPLLLCNSSSTFTGLPSSKSQQTNLESSSQKTLLEVHYRFSPNPKTIQHGSQLLPKVLLAHRWRREEVWVLWSSECNSRTHLVSALYAMLTYLGMPAVAVALVLNHQRGSKIADFLEVHICGMGLGMGILGSTRLHAL